MAVIFSTLSSLPTKADGFVLTSSIPSPTYQTVVTLMGMLDSTVSVVSRSCSSTNLRGPAEFGVRTTINVCS